MAGPVHFTLEVVNCYEVVAFTYGNEVVNGYEVVTFKYGNGG